MRSALAPLALALPLAVHAAGGHHSVDDATILESGRCEFETWVTYASSADHLLHAGGQCRVGAVELAIAAEPGRQDGTRTDAWQAQVKWAMPVHPRLAIGASVTPQWDTRQRTAFQGTTVAALLTAQPIDDWQLHANVGHDWLRSGHQARSGVAADWTPNGGRWLFATERYLENRTHFARGAVRWFATDEWTLDVSRAQRLHGPRPSNWTIAVTRALSKD